MAMVIIIIICRKNQTVVKTSEAYS